MKKLRQLVFVITCFLLFYISCTTIPNDLRANEVTIIPSTPPPQYVEVEIEKLDPIPEQPQPSSSSIFKEPKKDFEYIFLNKSYGEFLYGDIYQTRKGMETSSYSMKATLSGEEYSGKRFNLEIIYIDISYEYYELTLETGQVFFYKRYKSTLPPEDYRKYVPPRPNEVEYVPEGRQEYYFSKKSYGDYLYGKVFYTLDDALDSKSTWIKLDAEKYSSRRFVLESIPIKDPSYVYDWLIIDTGEQYVYKHSKYESEILTDGDYRRYVPKVLVEYKPEGKEEYIFIGYPYGDEYFSRGVFNTLKDSESMSKAIDLSASEYKNKRFYIESVAKKSGSYTYYWIVIETGEKYVYECYGTIEEVKIPDFIKYDEYLIDQEKVTKKKPLYEGSSIFVTKVEYSTGSVKYHFSNGGVLYESEWDKVLVIINEFLDIDGPKKEKVAGLFTKASLVYQIDHFDKRVFIRLGGETSMTGSSFTIKSPPVEVYIGIQDGRVWGRLKATYTGENWIFAKSITLGADEKRWDSGIVEFNRRVVSAGIMEEMDIPVSNEIITFMEQFCEASDSKVRFRGDSKTMDRSPSSSSIAGQRVILNLYRVLVD